MASSVQYQEGSDPVSISSGVLARSLWWLASGIPLNCQGRSGPERAKREEAVTTPDQIRTLEQVRQVVQGLVALKMPSRKDDALRYRWIDTSLKTLQYRALARSDRGTVLHYLQRLTGYSRAQVNRLVARWMAGQTLAKQHPRPSHAFSRRYQDAEIACLTQADGVLGRLSGAATVAVLKRQSVLVADPRWSTLASISVSQLYRLRQSPEYVAAQLPSQDLVPKRPARVGARPGPRPTRMPGRLCVDSVTDGPTASTWRVSLVDEASQWRVLIDWPSGVAGEGQPELALAAMVRQLPFALREIVATDGDDERCRQVAGDLEAARTEGLPLPPDFELDPWGHFVNMHRPSVFATAHAPDLPLGSKRMVMTPVERLLELGPLEGVLRGGVTKERLQAQAASVDPLTAASKARAFIGADGVSHPASRSSSTGEQPVCEGEPADRGRDLPSEELPD